MLPHRRRPTGLAAALVRALLLSAAVGLGGCKSTAIDHGDADLSEVGVPDTLALDAACNALTQLGAPVIPSCDPGSAPAATGGPISDGTYLLTESRFYGDCSTQPLAETIVVSQGTVQSIATGPGDSERRSSVSYLPGASDTTLSETQTCPARVQTTIRFSATATTLSIYLSTVLATRVSTFTRATGP